MLRLKTDGTSDEWIMTKSGRNNNRIGGSNFTQRDKEAKRYIHKNKEMTPLAFLFHRILLTD